MSVAAGTKLMHLKASRLSDKLPTNQQQITQ